MTDHEPPQEWFECNACEGEGQVFSHMSGSICSGAIDPPFEVYEPCSKCGGDGGWLDERKPDTEGDYCPYRCFTEEEEAAWERVFAESRAKAAKTSALDWSLGRELERKNAEIDRLRLGLKMIAGMEYEVGYEPETFAAAVLIGYEPDMAPVTSAEGRDAS